MSATPPREGMMAVVRNRRAMIASVQVFDADEAGRFHPVKVEYTADRAGASGAAVGGVGDGGIDTALNKHA